MIQRSAPLRAFCGVGLGSLVKRKKKDPTQAYKAFFFHHCLRSRLFLFIIWPKSIQRTTFHNFNNFIKFVWPFETSFWKVTKQKTQKQTNIARSINFEFTFISTLTKWNWFFLFLYNEKCIKLSVPIRECII